MSLSESMENYLEAIFEIERNKRVVRVRDVANKLGVTMPSVNGALKHLEAKGLISHEKYEFIELTKAGATQASAISKSHRTIFTFLNTILGVDAETAEIDACRLEHDLSVITLKKIAEYLENMEGNILSENSSTK